MQASLAEHLARYPEDGGVVAGRGRRRMPPAVGHCR
jgi:hypothetical protein